MVNSAEAAGELSTAASPAPPGAGDVDAVRTRRFHVDAARELLVRTAELPGSKRELLRVLREYRVALHAFAVEGGGR
jgi:hypothetical protein